MYARNNFSGARGKLPSDIEIISEEQEQRVIPAQTQEPQRTHGGRRAVHISRAHTRDVIPPPDYGGTVMFEKLDEVPQQTASPAAPIKRKLSPHLAGDPDKITDEKENAAAESFPSPRFDLNLNSDDILLAALAILLLMSGAENGGKADEELLLVFALLLFA